MITPPVVDLMNSVNDARARSFHHTDKTFESCKLNKKAVTSVFIYLQQAFVSSYDVVNASCIDRLIV